MSCMSSIKIPLHAAIECILLQRGCILASSNYGFISKSGGDPYLNEWYKTGSLVSGTSIDRMAELRELLELRKVCHSLAYGSLKHMLLRKIVLPICFGVSQKTFPECATFWTRNIRFVRRVVVTGFGIIGFEGSLMWLRDAHEILFKSCTVTSETLKLFEEPRNLQTHKVYLSWCRYVDDISSLRNIHTIGMCMVGSNNKNFTGHAGELFDTPLPLDCSRLDNVHTFMSNLTILSGWEEMVKKMALGEIAMCRIGGVTGKFYVDRRDPPFLFRTL